MFWSPVAVPLNLPAAAQSLKESAQSSKPCRCISMARVCRSRSEVRNTDQIVSDEEAKIKAELAEEIEKALQKEIEEQISNLTRRLEELRLQTKSDISVKKSSLTKGVLPKNNNGGVERKMKFKWENSLRSTACENRSLKRRPWNDQLSNPAPPRIPTVTNGKENCRCAERLRNSL